MRAKTKLLLGLVGIAGLTLVLGACSYPHEPYSDLSKQGFNVRVHYDRNGGVFSSASNVEFVDVYSAEKAENGVKLIAPGDAIRGKTEASTSTVTRSGYFLVGWYKTVNRAARADENGTALDEAGVPCAQSNKPQADTYEGKWDFGEDLLTLDDCTKSEEDGKTFYDITFHAAWAPNFTYTFYEQEESGWNVYGSFAVNPLTTTSINVPAWNEETGVLNYYNVPTRAGYTFEHAYADAEATAEYDGTIGHSGKIDTATGTVSEIDCPVYTAWREGTWFHIKTAAQLANNVRPDGCYEILADLDFNNDKANKDEQSVFWPFSSLDYAGTMMGNGYTIGNIISTQASGDYFGGLFGRLMKTAKLDSIKFEDITLELTQGTRHQGGGYGLLAGNVDANAAINGVTLAGEIGVGNLINTDGYRNFTIGLVNGNCELVDTHIDAANIKVFARQADLYDDDNLPYKGYPVKVHAEGGIVTVEENEDPKVDPNETQAS